VHNRTDFAGRNRHDGAAYGPSAQTRDHMLLLIGALVSLIAMVILSRVRRAFDIAKLGCMSPQWLASYRATQR
jgi:hypothetical protein